MESVILYLIKSSLLMALFYLFYRVLMSRETFHAFNRALIISMSVLSISIPLLKVSLHRDSDISALALNISDLYNIYGERTALNTISSQPIGFLQIIIVSIYLMGFLTVLSLSFISHYKMIAVIRDRKARVVKLRGGVRLIIVNRDITPFSWFRYIVINEKDILENRKAILNHEAAHIERLHSIDMIVAEVMKIIYWFNPAAWLFKQELRNIHEFQADESVINKGIDATQYQLLLIKKAVGQRLYTIANSFNHSKLKTRITMISKKRSKKSSLLKAMFVAPISLVAVLLFANESNAHQFSTLSTTNIVGSAPKNRDLSSNDTIPKKERVKKVTEKVIIIRTNENDSKVVTDTTKKVIVINVGDKSAVSSDSTVNALIVVDGEVKERGFNLSQIKPQNIESISVLKDKAAIERYGDAGKKGVIEIKLKK